MKIKLPVFIAVLNCVFSLYGQDIKSPAKTSVAVFQFLSESKNSAKEVLDYSLREKLASVLFTSNKFQVVGLNIINDRIMKRNLDVRTNLNNPRIIQYIGGLVEAQVLVVNDYSIVNDQIIITTKVLDATEGGIIRSYRMSGKLNNIDAVLNRIAVQLETDTQIWKQMGKLENTSSMAHHLGKLVAQTESVIKNEDRKKADRKKIDWKRYLNYIFNARIYFAKHLTQELYYLFSNSQNKSFLQSCAGWAFFLIGEKYYNTHDYEKSEKNFEYALRFLPKDEKIMLKLADFYFEQGNSDKSVKIYTRCIGTYPESVDAYVGITRVFLSQNSYLMAIYFAGQGLSINPEIKDLYLLLATAYAMSDKYDKAIATLQVGLKKFPDDQELNKILSYCYTQIGNEYIPQDKIQPIIEERK